MFSPYSLFVGLRYVRRREGSRFAAFISASSTLGIALGVMVLIVVFSAMNGFERELSQRLLGVVPHAELVGVHQPINDWQQQIAELEKSPSVNAAAPVIKFSGMLQKGAQLKAADIRSVEPELEQRVSTIADYVVSGRWQHLAKDNGVVIGAGIAKKLGLRVGEQLQLLLPSNSTDLSNQFIAPIIRNVEVVAIFRFGGTLDDNLVYMSLAQGAAIKQGNAPQQQVVDVANSAVDGLRLQVTDVFNAPMIARQVAQQLDHYVYIYDWTYTQGHLYNDIQLVRMVMFIVLTLVIAVACFNIVSTLVMVVTEKQSDIAILMTMGASPAAIMIIFITQGLTNGVLGCALGGLLGSFLAVKLTAIIQWLEQSFGVTFLSGDVYFIDFLPSQLQSQDVVVTVSVALTLSILATFYPAWRATKVQPAQVLGQG